MLDPRVLAITLALGAVAIAAKLIELYRWHVDREPLDGPPPVRIELNGRRIADASLSRMRPTD